MEFRFKNKSFFQRLSFSLLVFFGSLAFLIFISTLIDISIYLKIAILVIMESLTLIRLIISRKMYVLSIIHENNQIEIKYLLYNKEINKRIEIKNFDILYGGFLTTAYTTQTTLLFRENKRRFLIQYPIGDWNFEKMKEIYDYIKKIKREDRNI
jgi:hypothetical protein